MKRGDHAFRAVLFGAWALFVVLWGLGAFNAAALQNQDTHSRDTGDVLCGGFKGNVVTEGITSATISGGGRYGFPNAVTGEMGSIGGGAGNKAGVIATVGGGSDNIASGIRATISGGARNQADMDGAVIGGGTGNLAQGDHTTVAGGMANEATQNYATVGGGNGNIAAERHATVCGGTGNRAAGFGATTGGGIYNTVLGTYATISGGINNKSVGLESMIGGGAGNRAWGETSTIPGGMNNRTTDSFCSVGGGRSNVAGNGTGAPNDASYASVGGGLDNEATGAYAVVPGGCGNRAAGPSSLAAGHRAKVQEAHHGSILFADDLEMDFSSAAPREFAVRATGGIRLLTALDDTGKPRTGARLAPGGGSWETLSDRKAKDHFSPIQGSDILQRLMTLPLQVWTYRAQDPGVRHIGPTAQDFFRAFGFGSDDGYISTVDADGVALGAIQGLYGLLREKDAEREFQQRKIRELERIVQGQKTQIDSLKDAVNRLDRLLSKVAPDTAR